MPSKNEDPPKAANHRNKVVAHMMTPGVVQIPGDVSVTEAASLMERERMPCLLVKDSESCFGLMTPTDIVKKVVALGLEPDTIDARTIMTRPVQFIEYDRMIGEASALMLTSDTPILIVTKQEQPVGVLTARDLILSPKRCPANIPATITVMNRGRSATEYPAVILQLNSVGALMESTVSLPPETTVIVTFSLSALASSLTVQGRILSDYHRTDATGRPSQTLATTVDVHFTRLSPADYSSIETWVLQNESAFDDPS